MRRPDRTYVTVFLSLLALFTLFTYLITSAVIDDGPDHGKRVIQTTLGTISGPLTGAISRGFQGCCLVASLQVMAFSGPALLFCLAGQFIPVSDYRLGACTKNGTLDAGVDTLVRLWDTILPARPVLKSARSLPLH